MTRTWKLSMYICEACFDTLLRITTDDSVQGCLQQFVQSILWYDIFKKISRPRICLHWYQGLNCTVTLCISWFSKGKDVPVLYKSAFSPIPLLPEKRLYSSGTIFVLYPMRNDFLRFTFHRSCTVFRDCSYD